MGSAGGDCHLPIKGVGQDSLAETTAQNVGRKELNMPAESEHPMQTLLRGT